MSYIADARFVFGPQILRCMWALTMQDSFFKGVAKPFVDLAVPYLGGVWGGAYGGLYVEFDWIWSIWVFRQTF